MHFQAGIIPLSLLFWNNAFDVAEAAKTKTTTAFAPIQRHHHQHRHCGDANLIRFGLSSSTTSLTSSSSSSLSSHKKRDNTPFDQEARERIFKNNRPAGTRVPTTVGSAKNIQTHKNNNSNNNVSISTLATAFIAAATLWSYPAFFNPPMDQQYQNSFILPTSSSSSSVVANAKEMASGSGSRVNKDPESLLRYGLPIDNKEVRQLQVEIEDIRLDIGSKRKTAALDDVKKARTIIKSKSSKLLSSCRDSNACQTILTQISDTLDPLEQALRDSTDSFQGSEQEREALDRAYSYQDTVQKQLTLLEEQMIPKGYETPVPVEYSDLPQLKGRATVEMVLKKPDGQPFTANGENYKEAKMVMIIDGYTAPVTGGNFVDLVNKGFYDKMPIQRSDGFVVQTGDPDGEAFGYTGGKPSKSIGAGPHGERLIPSEIFVKGDKGPFYESTIEDEGRGGQATVLPFSSYGAMGWARDEYDPNSGSSQFFWLLFDSDLTPAGKNVLDGRYPCFGYVVEGAEFLGDAREGDIIVSAKVTKGLENLKLPKD